MLKIENLSKTYQQGRKEALKDINLTLQAGEFTALLGQNGAGKSSLINVISGNVKKDRGRVIIGGYDLDSHELETKRIIGVVPQELVFDYVFTVAEVLQNQAGYFGLKRHQGYIDELLETLSLQDKRNARVRDLSGGMKRRLLIAKALVHQPQILFLDEPTAGVDIELRHSLYAFLNRLHQAGVTIALTTHYLEEAERLCNRVIIINDGRIIADQPKERLMAGYSAEVTVAVQFEKELDLKDFRFLEDYQPRIGEKTILVLKVLKNDLNRVFQKIAGQNMEFINFNVERPKLEDIYLDLIQQ